MNSREMAMSSFWDSPENVGRSAAREPDVRLTELLREYAEPASVRVLDLGCAGGRNAVVLAGKGFDVEALDASPAMIAKTRERVAGILGPAEAARRVRVGRMDELSFAPDGRYDLVVALGLYHCAQSRAEWDRTLSETARGLKPGGKLLVSVFPPDTDPNGGGAGAVARPRSETARVLKPGGKLLVSVFTPETDLTGRGTHPVPGEPDLYEGFDSGRHLLVDAARLDAELARFGLRPLEPTRTARPMTEVGRRVSANGLYRKSR